MLLAVQSGMNSQLRLYLGSPFWASGNGEKMKILITAMREKGTTLETHFETYIVQHRTTVT